MAHSSFTLDHLNDTEMTTFSSEDADRPDEMILFFLRITSIQKMQCIFKANVFLMKQYFSHRPSIVDPQSIYQEKVYFVCFQVCI